MNILKIPVTATNMVEWVRRCADAVNEIIRRLGLVTARMDTAETDITGLDTRMATAEGAITALETFAAAPFTLDSVTFTPQPLPGTPSEGLTQLDSADSVLKIYVSGTWHSLF